MVNIGLNPSSIVGIALAIGGAGLYFLRNFKPALARDYDIFFAAVALLCGGILFFQGWRQDPILQFGQFMLAGTAAFFAYESIRLRGIATEQAKRTTPVVDDERPISRVYRAELDDYNALDERPVSNNRRRISATRDARSSRDEFDDVRRSDRAPRLAPSEDRPRSSKRRSNSRPSSRSAARDFERSVWDDDLSSREDDLPVRPSRNDFDSDAPRPRRPRPQSDSRRDDRPSRSDYRDDAFREPKRPTDAKPPASDYVDYQPIDDSDSSPRFE
ncbi:Ycf66 family protein [Microcoleus sp. FACHB-1515]|uniref:Ycf66 family protein n=1 Tax=Cyanophyceae TaxID=3028117 RepID=UPI001686404F|nr:Ycf66 family protein [Microcoleus sp. FACHB-1515]MBD2090538.1 Ycf66 family protein [Microcoleus sp. FACHB-1515]